MAYETVKVDRDGHIATITLNRPEMLNALNTQITLDFHAALDEIAADEDIRVVILTGEGRGFCSGADLSGRGSPPAAGDESARTAQRERVRQNIQGHGIPDLAVKMRDIPQPIVGAINGVAVGAGLAVALSCDIRVASDLARFASIFIKRSIMPDTGTSSLLPQLVGPGIASEMTLTGTIYDAQWALDKGLVNKVVPHDQLMEEARAYADLIAGNPPIAVRLTKRLVRRGMNAGLEQAVNNESVYNNVAGQTEDSREAVRAFLEKRQPTFQGR